MARQSLKAHHLSLLRNLTTSLAGLKETQSESLSVLPRPSLYREPANFVACRSVTEVLATMGEKSLSFRDIPSVTLLRCAIEDLNNERDERVHESTTEAIFRYLQERIPQLFAEESLGFEVRGIPPTILFLVFNRISRNSGRHSPLARYLAEFLFNRHAQFPRRRMRVSKRRFGGRTRPQNPQTHPLSSSLLTDWHPPYPEASSCERARSSTPSSLFLT